MRYSFLLLVSILMIGCSEEGVNGKDLKLNTGDIVSDEGKEDHNFTNYHQTRAMNYYAKGSGTARAS